MIYDKGYEDLMLAIIKRAIDDLIEALCEREYARHFLGNIDRSKLIGKNDSLRLQTVSALSTYRMHDKTVKEIENFLKSDLVSLFEFNGVYLYSLVCGRCKDMNYDYTEIQKNMKGAKI